LCLPPSRDRATMALPPVALPSAHYGRWPEPGHPRPPCGPKLRSYPVATAPMALVSSPGRTVRRPKTMHRVSVEEQLRTPAISMFAHRRRVHPPGADACSRARHNRTCPDKIKHPAGGDTLAAGALTSTSYSSGLECPCVRERTAIEQLPDKSRARRLRGSNWARQLTSKRPPEPCVQVRILLGAQLDAIFST
jgi:hypothetical protein